MQAGEIVVARVLVSTSPAPVASTRSSTLGRPSGVRCMPIAPGSTPVSRMATTTPAPSQCGRADRKTSACVSDFGTSPVHGEVIVCV